MKNVVGLLDGLAQPLYAAEHDVLFLHVRREAVGHELSCSFVGGLVWLRRVSQE